MSSDPKDAVVAFLADHNRKISMRGSTSGGGEPPDDTDRRLNAVERSHDLIIGKLDGIAEGVSGLRLHNETRFGGVENRLMAIETKLDVKSEKSDLTPIEVKLATVDGRLANVPTFWQTFFLILGAIVTTVTSLAGLGVVFAKFMKP